MADHTIHIDYDGKNWSINPPHLHYVKAKHTIDWKTNTPKSDIEIAFRDTVVKPSQFRVPKTTQVIDNPTNGEHSYDVTADGKPVTDGRGAPGIIIE